MKLRIEIKREEGTPLRAESSYADEKALSEDLYKLALLTRDRGAEYAFRAFLEHLQAVRTA